MKQVIVHVINIFIAGIFLLTVGCEDNGALNNALNLFYISNGSSYKKCSIKEYPETITTLKAKASEEESQATENSNETDDSSVLWTLFDSNTISSYTASTSHKFTINFGKTIALSRIKLFGSTTYTMNAYIGPDDDLVKIPSLCVDQSILKDRSWNTFSADEPVKTDSIVLEIIPNGDTGISELEFWSEKSVNVADGSLTDNLENITASENLKTAVEKSKNHVVEISALPNEISISGSEEESVTAQMRISLSDNPIIYKRAYIQYKAKNILTPVSIERRINNYSWNGGYDVPTKEGTTPSTDWVEHFEEINPTWLAAGDNTIEFRTNKSDVSIQNLTLVLVKDNGWNQVVAVSKPEAYDDDVATAGEIADASDTLDIEFERIIEPEYVMFSLANKSNARVSIQYLSNSQWLSIKNNWTIDLSEMDQGWNRITLPVKVQTKALRLQIVASGQGASESGAVKFNEIRVCGSSVGDPNIQPRIIVSYPRNGEYYGRTAYIQGFVNSAYQAQIGVENNSASSPVQDNSFSLSLSKDTTRFSGQEDDTAWDPLANAVRWEYSISKSINLTSNKLSASSGNSSGTTGGTTDGTTTGGSDGYTTEVLPDSAKTITFGPITIEIPAGAVDEKITITIIPLSKSEVAALNPGMINVTYPAAGYRFLVNGKQHYNFRKPINISFTYSKTLLLQGQSDNDVFMYYYAESQKAWKRLRRLNTASAKTALSNTNAASSVISPVLSTQTSSGVGVIVSETDHFTDIINGTITVPEQPDPLLYNPNTIKDIKVGDPAEGVNLIEPPAANNMGEARLSYPIEVPPGRRGMQPHIAVLYNSSNENGWLGVGWDIPVRAIAVDTKFGVPRYDGTEKYLLDGESIEFYQDRPDGSKLYKSRVEGLFRRIIRRNSTCATFTWEVIDKDGTKYIFGANNDSRLSNNNTPGNIFMWCLERIEDANGNCMLFHYVTDTYTPPNGGETSKQIYLQRITYTGLSNTDGPYSVVFNRDDGLQRKDVVINCRSGFKVMTRHRLKTIDVNYNGVRIRQYAFSYRTKTQFEKSLVDYIYQCDRTGCVFKDDGSIDDATYFTRHAFTYFDEVGIENNETELNLFNSSISTNNEYMALSNNSSIQLANKRIRNPLDLNEAETPFASWGILVMGPYDKKDAMGHNTENIDGSYSVNKFQDPNTLGFKGISSHGSSTIASNNLIEIIDINGDGLLDQVYLDCAENKIYYRKNLGHYNDNINFEPISHEIISLKDNVNNLRAETSANNVDNLWLSSFLIKSYSLKTQNGSSSGDSYFSDVNGDGLVDFINNGQVFYNSIVEGEPTFTDVRPSGFGSDNDKTLLPSSSNTLSEEEIRSTYYRDDPLLMWEAPYGGRLRISGDVALLPRVQLKNGLREYATNDGVRVSINKGAAVLWSQEIPAQQVEPVSPGIIEDVLVNAGDRIYFRVNSINDGAFDVVEWNPHIEYVGVDASVTDENMLPYYNYEAKSDLCFAGDQPAPVSLFNGDLHIDGKFFKTGITTDDINIKISALGDEGLSREIVYTTIDRMQTGEIEIGMPVDVSVAGNEKLYCELKSDTPIDWRKINFNPVGSYNSIQGMDSAVDDNGNPLITFNIPVTIGMYTTPDKDPIFPLTVPEGKSGKARIVYSVEPLPNDPLVPDDYIAVITLAVKRNGILIQKKTGTIQKTSTGPILMDFELDVASGEKYDFVCASNRTDINYVARMGNPTIYYAVDNQTAGDGSIINTGYEVQAKIYYPRGDGNPFAGGFHNWYYGRWNGEINDLDPGLMKAPDMNGMENVNENNFQDVMSAIKEQMNTFSPMTSSTKTIFTDGIKDKIWIGQDTDCLLGAVHNTELSDNPVFFSNNPDDYKFVMGSTRIKRKNIDTLLANNEIELRGGVLYTENNGRFEKSIADIDGDGEMEDMIPKIDLDGDGVEEEISNIVHSNTLNSFFDFNGDGYPEIINNEGFHCTKSDGSIDNGLCQLGLDTINMSTTISTIPMKETDTYQYNNSGTVNGFSSSGGKGRTTVDRTFIDVNGDSLPDLVYKDSENTQIMVRYNLGYGLGEPEVLAGDCSDFTKYANKESATSFGGLYDDTSRYDAGGTGRVGAGYSHSIVFNGVESYYNDINGDGLPDFIEKINNRMTVRFNTGSGFTGNSYIIGDLFYTADSGNYIELTSTETNQVEAIACNYWFNGVWGMMAWIISGNGSSQSQTYARLVDIDGDGLVDRIKGGSSGLDTVYLNNTGKTNLLKSVARPLGGSFELDYSRSKNTQDMPHSKWNLSRVTINDGMESSYTTEYSYGTGYYDRGERSFYGYDTVTETRPEASTINHLFYNSDYFRKGIERQTEFRKGDRLYTRNIMYYNVRDISEKIKFPYVERKETYYHEGNSQAAIFTMQSYVYDDYGNITKFTDNGDAGDGDNVIADIQYSRNDSTFFGGKPSSIEVRDADGKLYRKRICTYNSDGTLDSIDQYTDNGTFAHATIGYDGYGNITKITAPDNHWGQQYFREYAYDDETHTHITRISDAFGYSSTISYNPYYGKPSTKTDINDNVIKFSYDPNGRISEIRGPNDADSGTPTYKIDYDIRSMPARSFTYNKSNDLTNETIKIYSYIDGLKRTIQTKKDTEVNGRYCMVASGSITYNNMGQIIRQGQPVENTADTAYTPSSEKNPTLYAYDDMGRVDSIYYPNNTESSFSYSIADNRFTTTATDQIGKTKISVMDIRGKIISVTEGIGITTRYYYNPIGEITRVLDAQNNPTDITYDLMGRRTSIDNRDTGRIDYEYDLAGNLLYKTTPNLRASGQSIAYDYEFNRLQHVRYPNTEMVSYSYGSSVDARNLRGRLIRIENGNVIENRNYDRLGNVSESSRQIRLTVPTARWSDSYITRYIYDTMGRMQNIEFPDGETVSYAYDRGGLLKSVGSSASDKYIDHIYYNVSGQRTEVQYGNGAVSKYNYNDTSGLLENLNTSMGNTVIQNITYTHDGVGNITSRDNNDFTTSDGKPRVSHQEYGYDAENKLDRLISSNGSYSIDGSEVNNYTSIYTYDSIGNILTKTQTNNVDNGSGFVLSPGTSYTYNYTYNSSRPHAVASTGVLNYGYDANGNMTTATGISNGFLRALYWDDENRLSSTVDNGVLTEYKYDDKGKRVIKKGNMGEVAFVNDNYSIRNGDVTSKHIFAGNTRVATKMSVSTGDPAIYYYHGDHLGSSSVITNNNKSVHENLEYFPYGETWIHEKASSSQESMPYKFTSQMQDNETGLYYFGARYFEPKLSKWISSDPAISKFLPVNGKSNDELPGLGGIYNPINLNAYNYAGNSPIRYLDTDGCWYIDISGNAGGLLGGIVSGIQIGSKGLYWYTGVGMMSSSGGSISWSPGDSSSTYQCGLSVFVPKCYLGGQYGYSVNKNTENLDNFWETGIGSPGACFSFYRSFEIFGWGKESNKSSYDWRIIGKLVSQAIINSYGGSWTTSNSGGIYEESNMDEFTRQFWGVMDVYFNNQYYEYDPDSDAYIRRPYIVQDDDIENWAWD